MPSTHPDDDLIYEPVIWPYIITLVFGIAAGAVFL